MTEVVPELPKKKPRGGMNAGEVPNSKTRTNEWLTPPYILKALGDFDLDPCAVDEDHRPWPTAKNHFTFWDNGLAQEWEGRVWLNPPYNKDQAFWMKRMAEHKGGGVALLFARTDNDFWHSWIFPYASGVFFMLGRLCFYTPEGKPGPANASAPSALIAYGDDNVNSVLESGLPGTMLYYNK